MVVLFLIILSSDKFAFYGWKLWYCTTLFLGERINLCPFTMYIPPHLFLPYNVGTMLPTFGKSRHLRSHDSWWAWLIIYINNGVAGRTRQSGSSKSRLFPEQGRMRHLICWWLIMRWSCVLFINKWTTTINYRYFYYRYNLYPNFWKVPVNIIARFTDTKNLQNMIIRGYFGGVNVGKQRMVIQNCLLSMPTYWPNI